MSRPPGGRTPPRATRTRLRQPFAGRRAREIGSKLRLRGAQARDEAQAAVRRITGELAGPAGLAEKAAAEGRDTADQRPPGMLPDKPRDN